MRDFATIYRHIALVALTYSLLRAVPHDKGLLHKLQHHIETKLGGSAGCWPHNTQAQALWSLASFIGHRPIKDRGHRFLKAEGELGLGGLCQVKGEVYPLPFGNTQFCPIGGAAKVDS